MKQYDSWPCFTTEGRPKNSTKIILS